MADVVVNLKDIDAAIFDGISDNKELRRAFDDLIDDVEHTWKMLSPKPGSADHRYATGDYLAHIKKKKLSRWYRGHMKNLLRKGIPIGMVYNDSDIAHFVEYGTGPDNPDSRSPFGPDTPTPEFAPMRRTYARFLLK